MNSKDVSNVSVRYISGRETTDNRKGRHQYSISGTYKVNGKSKRHTFTVHTDGSHNHMVAGKKFNMVAAHTSTVADGDGKKAKVPFANELFAVLMTKKLAPKSDPLFNTRVQVRLVYNKFYQFALRPYIKRGDNKRVIEMITKVVGGDWANIELIKSTFDAFLVIAIASAKMEA